MPTKTGSGLASPAAEPSPSLRLHTIDEAAVILRCGVDYLYDLVHDRVAPHTRIGRRLLFTDEHLKAIVVHFERKPVKR